MSNKNLNIDTDPVAALLILEELNQQAKQVRQRQTAQAAGNLGLATLVGSVDVVGTTQFTVDI
ncbi:MAG: hypothetical protein M3Q36_04145 [bacterium]|nr:hypothetical protein [bacterium]